MKKTAKKTTTVSNQTDDEDRVSTTRIPEIATAGDPLSH